MAVMRRTPRSAGRPGRCGGGRRRQRGAADGDGRDTDAGALERREDGRDGGGTALRAGAQRATIDQRLTDAGDTRDGVDRPRVGAAVGQLDDDRVAAQLGLQLLRRAGRDDQRVRRWRAGWRGDRPRRGSGSSGGSSARPRVRQPISVHSFSAMPRIQARGRLVEEEDLRPMDEPGGDVELAAHAAGGSAGHASAAGPTEVGQQARPRASGARGRPARGCARRGSRFSRPLASGSTAMAWPTVPMTRRTCSGSRRTSIPATTASPSSGRLRVVRTFTVVDLPAPFRPRRPKTVPARR